MSLRISFDATAAARQSAGIGRYARELLSAIARRSDDIRYRVFYWGGGTQSGSLPRLDTRFTVRRWPVSDRWANALWHRAALPVPVNWIAGRTDLYHSPDFTLLPAGGIPTLLTVHDLAFLTHPECAYPTLRAYLERVVPRSVARASHIVAVSHSTARDLTRLLGVDPARITVIHEGVAPEFHPVNAGEAHRVLRSLDISEPYILSVGTIEPRKNYSRLFAAYARARAQGVTERLVVAGRRGWLVDPIFRRLRELGLERYVQFVSPGDGQLPALYSAARVFVFPSLYEGFGIPPLEALACGAVTVCSRTSSIPEVVGDAALMIDPHDVDDLTQGLVRALFDDDLRSRLRGAGPARAAGFTWDRAADSTVQLYQQVART